MSRTGPGWPSALVVSPLLWLACLSAPPESTAPVGEDDAGGHDSGAGAVCDQLFGDLRSYQACAVGPPCDFWIDLAEEVTCQDVCGERGAECVQSYDSSQETPCVREEAEECVGLHNTLICLCDPAP